MKAVLVDVAARLVLAAFVAFLLQTLPTEFDFADWFTVAVALDIVRSMRSRTEGVK